MLIKQQIIDPELEDDKYLRDYQTTGMFNTVLLKRNTQYNPLSHPKFLISNNQEYFQRIFDMLDTSSQTKADQVWDLIQKLPINQLLQRNLCTFEPMQESKAAWQQIFSPNSIFNLYYCLKILNTNFKNDANGFRKQLFGDLGGLHHLIECLVKLNIT